MFSQMTPEKTAFRGRVKLIPNSYLRCLRKKEDFVVLELRTPQEWQLWDYPEKYLEDSYE